MAKFIRFPFGVSGDRVAIPDAVDPGGAVSYTQGFGPDYELELGVAPTAKPVPRPETNQLSFDMTDNIRQYQLNGVPDWYFPADNGGVAISYPLNAVTRHNDLVYRSIVATNTVEPGTDPTKWVVDGVAGQATTAVAGLTRYATTAETTARTIADAAVTPAGLGALYNLLLNMPIYPEVMGATGLFTVTNPAGFARIAAGTQWVHRGAFTYTSVQTDLPTVANKTYHLRWDPTNGFLLYDLSNGAYNPAAVAESDPVFDTTYDSMLIARVVTNGANVATITTLINRAQLWLDYENVQNAGSVIEPGASSWALAYRNVSVPIGWSRKPRSKALNAVVFASISPPPGVLGGANVTVTKSMSRYAYVFDALTDYGSAGIGSPTLYTKVAFGG